MNHQESVRFSLVNKKDALGEASSLYMIIIILKGRKYEIILGEIVHTSKIPLACL
jgi:hypothetical protein